MLLVNPSRDARWTIEMVSSCRASDERPFLHAGQLSSPLRQPAARTAARNALSLNKLADRLPLTRPPCPSSFLLQASGHAPHPPSCLPSPVPPSPHSRGRPGPARLPGWEPPASRSASAKAQKPKSDGGRGDGEMKNEGNRENTEATCQDFHQWHCRNVAQIKRRDSTTRDTLANTCTRKCAHTHGLRRSRRVTKVRYSLMSSKRSTNAQLSSTREHADTDQDAEQRVNVPRQHALQHSRTNTEYDTR